MRRPDLGAVREDDDSSAIVERLSWLFERRDAASMPILWLNNFVTLQSLLMSLMWVEM